MASQTTNAKDESPPQETSTLLEGYPSVSFDSDRLVSNNDSTRSISSFLLRRLSRSERDDALNNAGVGPAAFLIRDAVLGEQDHPYENCYDPYAEDGDELRKAISLFSGRLSSYEWVTRFVLLSAWTLALLSFIEPPYWCRHSNLSIAKDSEFESCNTLLSAQGPSLDGETIVSYYPNSSSMWITVEESIKIEWVCVTIILLFVLLRLGRVGFELNQFFRAGHTRWISSLQIISIALIYYGLVVKHTEYHPFYRLILLGTLLKKFQIELRTLIGMLPQIVYILSVLVVILLFYAWIGVVLFYGSPQGIKTFPNLMEGAWTLWQCVTTVNYPDVMMPSFNENRLAGLYFISFMIISFFFIMNLVLASVVNAYDSAIEDRKKYRADLAHKNLCKAFHLMDPNQTGLIKRDTIMALFVILNQDFPGFKTLSDEECKLLFGLLDRDGSSTITEQEFEAFGNILLLELTKASDYTTFVEKRFPNIFHSERYQKLCSIIESAKFEATLEFILLLNAVVVGIESYPQLTGEDVELDPNLSDRMIDTTWELVETIFTIIYTLEVLLKVMVFGWKKYHETPRNVFDFCITVMSWVATVYVYYPNAYSNSRLIRYIVMSRVLRLLRVLTTVKEFRLIGSIAIEILPAAGSVILFLFFLMYLFAAIGMKYFGGMITRDPSNPLSLALHGTDFDSANYWGVNFNDLMSGLNVLFNSLVINNWTTTSEGLEVTTIANESSKWFVRLFFFSFHLFGVIFVNNLVIAFIINAFFQQLETINARKSGEDIIVPGEAKIHHEIATFDGEVITGTKVGLKGGYIARIVSRHVDVEVDEREQLRQLFTQTTSDSSNCQEVENDNNDGEL